MSMDYDDYIERDCECGHTEHRGPCSRSHLVFSTSGQPLPANATTVLVKRGMTSYRVPCSCQAFREYEGPLEPPDLDREAS